MPAVRLRVELADTPGSLAGVAAAIGAYGGNIVAIDALQSGEGMVVDEITVDLPDGGQLDAMRRAVGARTDARVISYQLAAAVDPMVRLLQRLGDLLDTVPAGKTDGLRRTLADVCNTPAVWVMSVDQAVHYRAGRAALRDPGAAVVQRTAETLPPLGESITGEAALLAIALLSGDAVALVGRSAEQGFTATEGSRIEAVVALYERLTTVMRPAAVAPARTEGEETTAMVTTGR
jgi:hypothetical protein